MKKKLLIVIAAVVALAAIVAGFVLFIQKRNSPEAIAVRAFEDFFEGLPEKAEASTVAQALRGGSLSFSLDAIEGAESLETIRAKGDLYFAEDALMAKDVLVFTADGEMLLSGNLYLSEELFYLEESTLFNGAYGVPLSELAWELDHSILAPDSGFSYALSESLANQIKNAVKKNELKDETEEVVTALLKEIYAIFCEHATFEKTQKEMLLGNEKTEVRFISVSLSPDSLVSFMRKAYTLIEDDASLRLLVQKYDQSILFDEGAEYESYDALFRAYMQSLAEWVDAYCREITVSQTPVSVELATSKRGDELLLLRVKEGVSTVFSLELGAKGIREADKITLTLGETTAVFETSTVGNSERTSLALNGEEIFVYYVNTAKNTFTLSFGDSLSFQGALTQEEDRTSFEIKSLTLADENGDKVTYATSISLEFNAKADFPDAPSGEYKKPSEITSEMLLELLEPIFGPISDGVFKEACTFRAANGNKISFSKNKFVLKEGATEYEGTYQIEPTKSRIFLTYTSYTHNNKTYHLSTPMILGGESGLIFVVSNKGQTITMDGIKYSLIQS